MFFHSAVRALTGKQHGRPFALFIFTKIPLGERPEAYLYGSYGA